MRAARLSKAVPHDVCLICRCFIAKFWSSTANTAVVDILDRLASERRRQS
jgi:hypothetical protein